MNLMIVPGMFVCSSFLISMCMVLFYSVFAITERRDISLYEVTLSVCLFGFGIGSMLANFHV